MDATNATPRRVIIRDLIIFQIKLLLDGLKDLVLSQLSFFAALVDVLIGGSRRGRIFYGAMRIFERFDLWLNLYSATDRARRTSGGLLEERPRGVDSLLSAIERILSALAIFALDSWRSRRRPSAATPEP
jgi:hypothetical protein